MPPINKETFIAAIADIASTQKQIARFIKIGPGQYWYETGKGSHKDIAAWQDVLPRSFAVGTEYTTTEW